jgi:hypothetical protein
MFAAQSAPPSLPYKYETEYFRARQPHWLFRSCITQGSIRYLITAPGGVWSSVGVEVLRVGERLPLKKRWATEVSRASASFCILGLPPQTSLAPGMGRLVSAIALPR